MDSLEQFAKRFLTGRVNWWDIPRKNAIINFGNIISLCLYKKPPYQVELFIVPFETSSFTKHKHPDVDVIEFGLTGDAMLFINGQPSCSRENVHQWQEGLLQTSGVRILPTSEHHGYGYSPYAFLSIQQWLHGVQPTSVGLNWSGEFSSAEQQMMNEQQMLA